MADMTLSEELAWRGLIKDKTFQNDAWIDEPGKAFYLGIDASADSLQVGNLAILILCLRLAKAGWKPVMVMGGGTSLVGDPGGKAEERELKSREEIVKNINGVRAQVQKLFAGEKIDMVDNYDWLSKLKYVDFLRDVGKHFSMTELMQREFVTERMGEGGSGISYAEFSYSLIQGYDFWHLFDEKNVVMQVGGSDQWGNLLSGVALIRKKEGKEVHAMSMPLVVDKNTGIKFGKSEGGAVWLDPTKTSPTQFYQFWINTSDEDVESFLKIFTELDKHEIAAISSKHSSSPQDRFAQIRLAHDVTRLVHGQDAMDKAENVTFCLIGKINIGEATNIADIRNEIPSINSFQGGSIVEALVKSGLASSNTEARRLLAENAISINGQKVARENFEPNDFQNGRLLIRRGKAFKDSALVELGK